MTWPWRGSDVILEGELRGTGGGFTWHWRGSNMILEGE